MSKIRIEVSEVHRAEGTEYLVERRVRYNVTIERFATPRMIAECVLYEVAYFDIGDPQYEIVRSQGCQPFKHLMDKGLCALYTKEPDDSFLATLDGLLADPKLIAEARRAGAEKNIT